IERAQAAGVEQFILTGASYQGNLAAYQLTQKFPELFYSTAGVHPHYSSEYDNSVHASIQELSQKPEVVAVGECGLDFNRNFSTPEEQENAFRRQLSIAREVQLPVFLHQRDAHEAFLEIITEQIDSLNGGVAHCFTGTKEQMKDYLDLGLYIGITGWICDERRGHDLQEAITYLPAERLLIETDAPYLLPRDLKPKPKSRRNEPMYLQHILNTIARLRNDNADELAEITSENTKRLFAL
ncbi:MAG: hydrolase TatD, partial [Gammaproteobacteria bacterium]|nr:hydrolase TatD [Gammaproteobacteria bacterium]